MFTNYWVSQCKDTDINKPRPGAWTLGCFTVNRRLFTPSPVGAGEKNPCTLLLISNLSVENKCI